MPTSVWQGNILNSEQEGDPAALVVKGGATNDKNKSSKPRAMRKSLSCPVTGSTDV